MIRTRHVAGSLAVTLLALPFLGASPASAAAGQVAVTGPLQTGDTETIDFTDGDETGKYVVELWKDAKVATITSGDDITALADYKWTIPTGVEALVGTGFKVKVVAGAGATFTAFESSTFAIEKSNINTVAVAGVDSGWKLGEAKTVTWDNSGQNSDTVDISIVTSAGKATVIEKGADNDETESVVLPLKVAAAAGYKIRVTPGNKAATAGDSAAFTVAAAGAPTIAFDDSTVTKGQTFTVTPTSASGPVKLDLVLKGTTKSLGVIAKEADSGEEIDYVIPSKLAAGTYSVIATVVGSKPAVTGTSGDLTVATYPAITLGDDTVDALAAGVTTGQSVLIEWESAADTGVTVTLLKGTTETKLNAKELTVDGDGKMTWVASTKLAAGTDYKIRVSNNIDPTVKVESSAFTVTVNTTVVGGTTATTTTVAATTTTAAATTTTAA